MAAPGKNGSHISVPGNLGVKYNKLRDIIRDVNEAAVAFSGGVDSALLLYLSATVLGGRVTAFTACSILHPREEIEDAHGFARDIGCRHVTYDFDPLSQPGFTVNSPQRCYYCKKNIYSAFLSALKDKGVPLLDGTNKDDLQEDRPGIRAITELGVRTPLAEAGLTKKEIRQLSRTLGLRTWNRLSSSCLATRIPFGTPVTREGIALIEKCERLLHSLGFQGCRVRLNIPAIHIELAEGDIERFMPMEVRKRSGAFFAALGIKKVFLDLAERKTDLG